MTEKDRRIKDLNRLKELSETLSFGQEMHLNKIIYRLAHQPPIREPESECNCKGGRHCKFCRKADYVGAGIEKLNEVSQEVRNNINQDIVNLWDKLNEVISRINKQ